MIEVTKSEESPHVITGSLLTGCTREQVEEDNKLVGLNTDPDTIKQLRASLDWSEDGNLFMPRSMSIRQAGKKSNHGLNYGLGYRSFALHNEMDETDAKKIVELYRTQAYPGIQQWWEQIRKQLNENRTLVNCFGRPRKFLDGWGADLFEQAYAYIPQSTVVDMVNRGMIQIYNDISPEFAPVELLAQVHDSLVIQYPTDDWKAAGRMVNKTALEYMNPLLKYRTREFRIETTMKMGLNWGDMHDVVIDNDPVKTQQNMEEAWEKINAAPTS